MNFDYVMMMAKKTTKKTTKKVAAKKAEKVYYAIYGDLEDCELTAWSPHATPQEALNEVLRVASEEDWTIYGNNRDCVMVVEVVSRHRLTKLKPKVILVDDDGATA